jgi:RNA polymerase primary sigma factor
MVENTIYKELKFKRLTKEEEVILFARINNGDKKAEEKVILMNIPFVHSVAGSYVNQYEFDDLVQAGMVGLIKAVRRFQPKKNFKFITYAVWWIRQQMLQDMGTLSRVVRVPLNQVKKIKTLGDIATDNVNIGRDCFDGMSTKDAFFYSTMLKSLSVDASIKAEDGSSSNIINIISNEKNEGDINSEQCSLRKLIISEANRLLGKRDVRIIIKHFGFEGTQATLQEIGDIYGVTRELIRQRRDKVIKILLQSHKIREYVKENGLGVEW